jgi:hypothetical protein
MGTFRLRSLAEAHRAPEHADFPREAYAAVHHYVSQTDEDSANWRGLRFDIMPWADEVWSNVTHVRTTTTTLRAATEETPLSAVIGVAATAPSLRRTAITLLGEVALKQNTRGILL